MTNTKKIRCDGGTDYIKVCKFSIIPRPLDMSGGHKLEDIGELKYFGDII